MAPITANMLPELRDLNPLSLSRLLGEVANRYQAFACSLREQTVIHHPFGKSLFPGKTHFDWASELADDDPLRTPLLRWIYFLTEARIHAPASVLDADLEYRKQHPATAPQKGAFSLAQMTSFALEGKRGPASSWWRTRGHFEMELSEHRIQIALRNEEIAERMGGLVRSDFWNPIAQGQGLIALAQQILKETSSAAENLWEAGWAPFVEAALARPATLGWPARLAPDTMVDLLFEKPLMRGVSLDPPRLPRRLSPMSFPRAATGVGRALSRALRSPELPFVVAHDPHDPSGHELGALLAMWTTSPPFLKIKLGANAEQVEDMRRALRPALLAHLRLSAARAWLSVAARGGRDQLTEDFRQISHLLCREDLPPHAAFARFSAPDDAGTRLASLLSAAAWYEELVEAYDDDWYRNPRAGEALREHLRRPSPTQFQPARLKRGLSLMIEELCH